MNRFSRNVAALLLLVSFSSLVSCSKKKDVQPSAKSDYDVPAAFSGDSAYSFVKKQVDFGPRVPGSKAHTQCGDWLAGKLKSYGAEVKEQISDVKTYDGKSYKCRNIMASFAPDKKDRVLLLSHWDCRPFSDNDADEANWRKPVDGANDGASGVGVLLEVARQLSVKPASVGVDILFVDVEDYGTPQFEKTEEYNSDTWCIGSRVWATEAAANGYKARFGILLDMVGSPVASFPKEMYSMEYAAGIVDKVWSKARRLGKSDLFLDKRLGGITDDHVQINQIAGIPTVDIIHYSESGFGHFWHTVEDNMSNVSAQTLQSVGEVVLSVVYDEK